MPNADMVGSNRAVTGSIIGRIVHVRIHCILLIQYGHFIATFMGLLAIGCFQNRQTQRKQTVHTTRLYIDRSIYTDLRTLIVRRSAPGIRYIRRYNRCCVIRYTSRILFFGSSSRKGHCTGLVGIETHIDIAVRIRILSPLCYLRNRTGVCRAAGHRFFVINHRLHIDVGTNRTTARNQHLACSLSYPGGSQSTVFPVGIENTIDLFGLYSHIDGGVFLYQRRLLIALRGSPCRRSHCRTFRALKTHVEIFLLARHLVPKRR